MRLVVFSALIALSACETSAEDKAEPSEPVANITSEFVDLSKREKLASIVRHPWHEVVITAQDVAELSRLFTEIGGFEAQPENTGLRLKAPGADSGFIILTKPDTITSTLIRPADSQAWDTGCYFSVMMRAKNLPSIITDAKALGWEPLTEMAFLEFGPSQLNIIVLTHKKTGVRVQLYERLTTALPEGFTPFERLSRPFNIMQMVSDRDQAYDFFQLGLGLETFYYGPATVSKKEEVVPIGIPPELSTTVPYKAAIVMPVEGAEWGRMEMIEVDGMPNSQNYSGRCSPNNIGIHTVRYKVEDWDGVVSTLKDRDIKVEVNSDKKVAAVKSPDGANIEFYK